MNDIVVILVFVVGAGFMCVGLPFALIGSILACSTWSNVRKWRKEKVQHFARLDGDVEMDGLIQEEDEDAEEEPIDSEDEAEINAKKEAQKSDWELTTYQKFRKELKRTWHGEAQKEATAKREREDRAKVAKDVAREMIRAERKRQKKAAKAQGKAQEAMENSLPTYDVATASSS
jgi:hypothetical protein